jgi:hypothetical protein
MLLIHQNPNVAEIEAPAMTPDRTTLERYGVLLLRQMFTAEEVVDIRRRVEAVVLNAFRDNRHSAVDDKYPTGRSVHGDLLGMSELRDVDYVFLAPRVIDCAKTLLGGGNITYFGDSVIRVDVGGRGFHKDFIDETAATRGALRFALYLQDHDRHSGGLKVRLGSHRRTSRHLGRMMNVATRPGDLAVFYLRTSHTGHNVRLRTMPKLCLHPKLESLVPGSWRLPLERRRICLLWTFGKRSAHVDRYLQWITRDPSKWKWSGYNSRLCEFAARRGVELLKAIPEHGELGGD